MRLEELIGEMSAHMAELERRLENMHRYGTVSQVDPAKQLVRMTIGGTDDAPMLSPWVPYGQVAGALKIHTPPSVGQQMMLFSPAGDFRQGMAMPFTWSDANASPGQKGDEHVMTFGAVTITVHSDKVVVSVGSTSFTLGTDGTILKTPKFTAGKS